MTAPVPPVPPFPGAGLTISRRVARCWWCGSDPLYRRYHDTEWGRPVGDDRRLFEKLCLEGFQAGLSWIIILRKRDAFRECFAGFDLESVAAFTPRHVTRLLRDARIVRHRGKIESVINNARRAIELAGEHGSLAAFIWRFEPAPEARPRRLDYRTVSSLARTTESADLGRALKKRGFSFVGPTTMYALMQAVGMVNDHVEGCAARAKVETARRRFRRPGL